MNLLSRRSVLAIAAVVDVASAFPVRASCGEGLGGAPQTTPPPPGDIAPGARSRQNSQGVRGPRGGYELARERRRITVGEIVRTAMSLSTADPDDLGANSPLLERVIDPAVRKAGETFLANLDSITVEHMCEQAERAHVLDDEKATGDFAI